jgi:hypothetical protein
MVLQCSTMLRGVFKSMSAQQLYEPPSIGSSVCSGRPCVSTPGAPSSVLSFTKEPPG